MKSTTYGNKAENQMILPLWCRPRRMIKYTSSQPTMRQPSSSHWILPIVSMPDVMPSTRCLKIHRSIVVKPRRLKDNADINAARVIDVPSRPWKSLRPFQLPNCISFRSWLFRNDIRVYAWNCSVRNFDYTSKVMISSHVKTTNFAPL